jgi:hypothetical protein
MSHFLWIEDFAGNSLTSATKAVFGELVKNQQLTENGNAVKQFFREHGVFVELTFLDGLKFIRNPKKLLSVDYVILDIDLTVKSESDTDDNQWLPKILQDYYGYEPQEDKTTDEQRLEKAKEQLTSVAGYQLYVELVMELGFPKEHILFCSSHAAEQEAIQAAFKQAKIELPLLFSKAETAKVQAWIKERGENHYSLLRRGILNVLDDIEAKNINLCDTFEKDVPVNRDSFLDGLRFMLSTPRQPSLDTCQHLYRTCCDYLTKYFDRFSSRDLYKGKYQGNGLEMEVPKEYAIPAYFVRNWVAHNIINNANSEFSAQDVGFLFIIVLKTMFDYSSLEMFKPLYDYPGVNDTDLQAMLCDLQNRHYSYSGQCEIFELIRLKGQKNWNRNLETEDFVAQMYASLLFGCVELKARTKAKLFTETAAKHSGAGYWVNLTYLIDSQRDTLYESLKSVAYHRIKERHF